MLLSTVANSDIAITLVNLGIILVSGLVIGRIFEKIKIPAVTGYLVAGLLLGEVTGYLDHHTLAKYQIISDIALGFIAFQVGNELWLGKLKSSGIKIIILTIFQAVITFVVVSVALMFFIEPPIALVLGAIATATAPAPIMMLVSKYRTKGTLTNTILPVVGIDDAVGVIIFGVILSLSANLLNPMAESVHFLELIKEPLIEIGISVFVGSAIGLISGYVIKKIDKDRERNEKTLDTTVIIVLISTGLALLLGASSILTPMIAGAFVTNSIDKDCYMCEEETIRSFIPPLMILFFTIAGAHLQFHIVIEAGIIGLMYIVSRVFGKMFGSYIGAVAVKSSENVKKYLGISLLPQSGVAIGLSISAYNTLHSVDIGAATVIKNVILASVVVFALIGPALVKYSFWKTGEMQVD